MPYLRLFRASFLGRVTLGLVLTTAVVTVSVVQAAGDCSVAAGELAIDGEEQAMLAGINAYRQQAGLRALAWSPTLTQAGAWLSRDMAAKKYFSHTDSLGRAFGVRLADCGYAFNTWKAEKIAAGNADATSTLNQWKNSPSHNAALLGSSYTAAGIGRAYDPAAPYRWYWTLDLGGYRDGGPPPASPTSVPPTPVPPTPMPPTQVPPAQVPPTPVPPTPVPSTPPPAPTAIPTQPQGAAPASPSDLRPGVTTSSSLQVLWDDNSHNETRFEVRYRQTGTSSWTFVNTAADATSYIASGLRANRSYSFNVRACNAAGCSAWSSQTRMTTRRV